MDVLSEASQAWHVILFRQGFYDWKDGERKAACLQRGEAYFPALIPVIV